MQQLQNRTYRPEMLAFNVWLSLLDELLDKQVPMANAMVYSGQRLQDKQEEYRKEHEDFLFHPLDLYKATEDINILLRRRPEYAQRNEGWSKSKQWKMDK